ncbi:condensin-2 complex subunit G2-like [Styela clava]
MGEKRREELLSCSENSEKCIEFVANLRREHHTKFGDFKNGKGRKLISTVSEIIQELNSKQLDSFWLGLKTLSINGLGQISSNVLDEENIDDNIQNEENKEIPFQVLEAVCIFLLSTVRLDNQTPNKDMLQILILLHGSLFDLYDVRPVLASCICTICVEWWNKNFASKEQICLNVITHQLRLFLCKDQRDKLSSICSMQGCLTLFDFKRKQISALENEDATEENYAKSVIEELREMLLSSFKYPLLLCKAEGRKFLSSVFLLHKELMKDAHQVIMDNIKHKFSLEQAEGLGNIYFQSWRSASQEMKESFEEICIQDLMYRAVHSPCVKEFNLFLPLKTMLSSIVCHKGGLEVRHMITRLYNPIIWRSLKANNAMVRANASKLLLDAFPLEEEDSNRPRVAENEEFMQRQYNAMNDMLMDVCPRVRVIGIFGLCNVLHMYWDAIPPHVIAILTRKLYNDLAFDATVHVRQAVFQATIVLLDTPCAHPLLAKLLPPCLEKCLHDINEKVRIAVAEVLLGVKQTSTIEFWSVCPIQNIIAQLEVDGMPVSKRLAKLLFRSFIPENKPVQVWVERCMNFFKREVNAARKFYSLVDKDLTVQEIGDFLNMIGTFVYNCVSATLQQENSSVMDTSSTTNSNDSQNSTSTTPCNTTVIEDDVLAALLDTSCILWKSLDHRTSTSKSSTKMREMMKKIMVTYSRVLHVCFKVSNDERTLNAILLLTSYLPPGSLPVFSKSVLPKLRSLPDDAPPSYYTMLIKCLCSWGWIKQLLGLIQEWLTESLEGTLDESSLDNQGPGETNDSRSTNTRRSARLSKSSVQENDSQSDEKNDGSKRKKKTVSFTVKPQHRPDQALKYLKVFMEIQMSCSYSALEIPQCVQLLLTIAKILEKCQVETLSRLSSSSKTDDSEIWVDNLLVEGIVRRCSVLSIIYLHQKNKRKDADSSEADDDHLNNDVPIDEFKYMIKWFGVVIKKYESTTKTQKSDLNNSILSNQTSSSAFISRLSLYRQLFNSTLQIFLDFLSCGIEVFEEVEDVVLQFCSSGASLIEYIEQLLRILLQLDEHKILQKEMKRKNVDGEEQTLVDDDDKRNVKIVDIFDRILTTLLQHARQNPDSFMQVFRQKVKQSLRTMVRQQNLVHFIHPNDVWYDVLMKKIISAIMVDLFHQLRSNQNFLARDIISDLPSFSACILPVLCATYGETAYICQSTIPILAKEESDSTEQNDHTLLIFAHLLYTLSINGKNPTAAEDCINTLCEELEGFDKILSKVKSKNVESSKDGESCNKLSQEGEDEDVDAEAAGGILVLEEPGHPDLFMNDEEFMI